MKQSDKRVYEMLGKLAKKQLQSIDQRLEAKTSRWSNACFLYRNSRIKRLLQRLWLTKGGSSVDFAGKAIMDDLDLIQSDDLMWPGFREVETDYIRLIFHGLHDVLKVEPKPETESVSVSVALPVMDR